MNIADTHCDTLCALKDFGASFFSEKLDFSLSKLRSHSYTEFFACYISPKYYNAPKKRCESLIDTYEKTVLPYAGKNFRPYLSIEGGECIENISDVEYYHNKGVKMIAPVWNNKNKIASGVDGNGGVTEYGKQVIYEMNRLCILLDLSHMNDTSFFEAIELTTLPPVASHSSSRALCENKRNLTDEQFKIIRDKGGFVGVNFYPPFLTGTNSASAKDIVNHIEHFLMLGGENTVGLGSDFDGIDHHPNDVPDIGHIDTLIDEMLLRGWSDCLMRKIMGENIENITRFFEI